MNSTSNSKNNNWLVKALVKLQEELDSLETRVAVIEFYLGLGEYKGRPKPPKTNNDNGRKWAEWARKVIAKTIELLLIIIAALIGVKLGGIL